MKKFSSFIAIIIIALYGNNAIAKTCPAGFFCTANGQYTISSQASTYYSWTEIPSYMYGSAELVVPGWGMWSDEGLCSNKKSDGTPYSGCIYTATDYDEVWVSLWFGFYTVKNGEVLYKSSGGSTAPGAFPCPGTYPSSNSGASSVFQCYRTTSNGQKEYYKTPNNTHHSYDGNYNTDDVNAILTSLQSALTQANSAAQNLESILKKSNNKIHIHRSNLVAIQADATIATQALDNIKTTNTTANNPTTTTQPTNTPTATTPPTIKLTETKSDSTTSSPLKKLDFGNLSSIFSADKAAVHNAPTGRAALPTHNARSATGPRSTQAPSPVRATTTGATSTPRPSAQTDTRINNKTKRIASER